MRIPPIEPGTRPELAKQEAQLIAERGQVSLLYQVLLNGNPCTVNVPAAAPISGLQVSFPNLCPAKTCQCMITNYETL